MHDPHPSPAWNIVGGCDSVSDHNSPEAPNPNDARTDPVTEIASIRRPPYVAERSESNLPTA